MKLDLPEPVAAYFAADKLGSDALARCFTRNALVKDEGRIYTGLEAIKQWKTDATAKYLYICEPVTVEKASGVTIVTGHLEGDFPGGKAELRYFFRLEQGKIASLEIIP